MTPIGRRFRYFCAKFYLVRSGNQPGKEVQALARLRMNIERNDRKVIDAA